MRCSSFCTASLYQIKELKKFLSNERLTPRSYDNVVHFQTQGKDNIGNVFIFPYGCIVIWGLEDKEEQEILALVKSYEDDSLNEVIEDYATYSLSEETCINEEYDEILLENDDVLIKLSLSYGMAQSVKLSAFEDTILKTIKSTRHLPQELVEQGRISLSRKKLSQQLGALFAERSSINLHTDILGTPEFFWRRPKYEPYYLMSSAYMDINTRLDILNRRLDVIHELYEVLSNELNHVHSSRLELTIIWLIVIEVLLVIIHDLLKWI